MSAAAAVLEGPHARFDRMVATGMLENMLLLSESGLAVSDIDRASLELCGSVRREAWGDDSVLLALIAQTRAGRRFELRGYLDPDFGLVTESQFRFLQ